jgi:hypothetical protein
MKLLKINLPAADANFKKNILKVVYIVFTFIFLTGCEKIIGDIFHPGDNTTVSIDNAAVATDWYKLQLQMILSANPAAPNLGVSRLFAYSGIALFESSRFEQSSSRSLQGQLNQMPEMPSPETGKKYSWVIAANAALASVTRNLFPVQNEANNISIDSLEKIYRDKFMAAAGSEIVSRSEAFGDSVAARIIRWSTSDLYNHVNDPYTPPVFYGAWVRTPPAFAAPATPYAGNCRTFMTMFSTGVTPVPPFAYSEDSGSDFYKMVNYIYTVSKSLTTDQKNIALFWNDVGVGVGYTPMGHGISILTQILNNSNASLATAGTAYAKAGIALWDASAVCWRSKYQYNQLRPVTYIQQHIDNMWLPLLATPPHPEFPAAHALITSAFMQTLASVFGNTYSFTDHTYDFRSYPARSYNSFEQVAEECGKSRVYGGIHFQQSVDIAHTAGQTIGKAAAALHTNN